MKFAFNRFSDRRVIVPLRRPIDKRIDPLPFRPEDFNESDPLVSAILKTGIQIDRQASNKRTPRIFCFLPLCCGSAHDGMHLDKQVSPAT